jgi:hypothetical protein
VSADTVRDLDRPTLPPPDKVSLWPVEGGRFGVDATFSGGWGKEYAKEHRAALKAAGLKSSLRREGGDVWTLRMGPLTGSAARAAVDAFLGL